MSDQIVYKVLSASELQQMQREGVFHGSPADIADGYIHLSCGSQVATTLDKHFSGVDGLVLAAVDRSGLGDTVALPARRRTAPAIPAVGRRRRASSGPGGDDRLGGARE
jgi:uncharacterized protein (DUF952 family)